MTLQSVDPRVTMLWRAQALLRLAFFWGPASAALGVGVGSVVTPAVGVVVGLAAATFLLAVGLLWPALEYEHLRYGIREHDLLVQRGVLFRRRTSIPHNRIQHVDTRQGPLERLFGLSQVAVYTASGMSAEGSIPGLTEEKAEAIRDELARLGGDDGV
ncbi:MAG: PH domain-containing protein [Alphaproteobacteria bacterium]|nr:PH domain-containing protein [Alphaproteobacteria bacterium]